MEHKVSTLYRIKPMHSGTAQVESLTSYMTRLSKKHCIPFGLMMTKLLTPLIDKQYITNISGRGGDGFYKSSNAVDGNGIIAKDFIKAMGELTLRDDLVETTLVRYEKLFGSRGLLQKKRAWCPICLESFREENPDNVYHPLIWSMELVQVCPKHSVRMETSCPHCRQEMNTLSRHTFPGYCCRCMKWLGNKEGCTDLNEMEMTYAKFAEKMVGLRNIEYEKTDLTKAIGEVVDGLFEGKIKRASRDLGFRDSTFRCWVKGKNQPTCRAVAKMCIALGVDLEVFLNDDEKGESRKEQQEEQTLKGPAKKPVERKRYNRDFIEYVLQRMIEQKRAVTIKQIAVFIGCDRTWIAKAFPKECQVIIAHNKKEMTLGKHLRLNIKLDEVERTFYEMIDDDRYPSFREMEKTIGSRSLLEKELRTKYMELRERHHMLN